ncbi:hypothetical protein EZS27_028568 [termite gut metagenome]|uniref:DUF2007 domain-containing protein n=1 Tax=termite gut metagenome TaxID=433724 RepID=A0A5J4QK68_9ZZZZ
MKTKREGEALLDIFSGSLWEAEIVKGLLESNGITSILKTGNIGTIAPYSDGTTVLVSEKDYQSAITIMGDRSISL